MKETWQEKEAKTEALINKLRKEDEKAYEKWMKTPEYTNYIKQWENDLKLNIYNGGYG